MWLRRLVLTVLASVAAGCGGKPPPPVAMPVSAKSKLLDRELPSLAPSPHEHSEQAQSWRFVRRFLDGLDDDKRTVFVLCQLEQASAPEVAEALGIPVNTVYSRLHTVRRAFREALAESTQEQGHD